VAKLDWVAFGFWYCVVNSWKRRGLSVPMTKCKIQIRKAPLARVPKKTFRTLGLRRSGYRQLLTSQTFQDVSFIDNGHW